MKKENLEVVKKKLLSLVIKEREKMKKLSSSDEVVYSAKNENISKIPELVIEKIGEDYYEIKSERIIRTKKLINLKTDEGIDRLIMYLDRVGLNEKLKEMKVKNGSTILIDDFEFEYFE